MGGSVCQFLSDLLSKEGIKIMKKNAQIVILLLIILLITACNGRGTVETPTVPVGTPVTLMLDWVPNTNHTGIYVSQELGYFQENGLEVDVIEPGEVFPEQAVAGGKADFGVSFQEQVTLARADNVPIVSIAAIIQHNTSGFASLADLGVESPKDWEGLRYGSYGSPFEEPTLRVLMECDGGDFGQLEIVDMGLSDPLALLDERLIDLAWIFYAWQGTQAELEGIDLNIIMMEDWFDCIPDYYTPVFIASAQTIQERPEVVEAFLNAISRGYTYAIDHPDQAASILLEAVPELDEELVRNSQTWLSPRYQADASRWGEQQLSVWDGYSNWMAKHGIIPEPINAESAFTNDFLP
jgi:ABC-type nitrate/sulfonate/bicarbonate transport system substrate-binding protein